MKKKLMVTFGAVLLTGALMTGCGTVEEDNDIDLREDEPPMEDRQNDTELENDDNRDNGNQGNDQLDEEMNDGEMNEQRDENLNDNNKNEDEK